jgi:excisionase family DNA binding protein
VIAPTNGRLMLTQQEAAPGEVPVLLVDVPGAAVCLGVSPKTITRMFDRGDLTKIKIGATTRVSVDEMRAWIAGQRGK